MTHLGQIIAGFKNGCNRRYWEITGQEEIAAKPLPTTSAPTPSASSASSPSSVAGGFATSGVFLGVEGCEVGCLLGRVVESRVDGSGYCCKLRPDSLLFGGGLRGARHGTEASEIDA